MYFDPLLKQRGVTLEESSSICRGASTEGGSPIDGYWSCLCDRPLLRNTGRHTVTFRILCKEREGQAGGWAVVGMASPASSLGSGPGGADDTVGVGSDGTSSVGPCLVRISKLWPRRNRALADAADGLQSFCEGDVMKLQLDTRSDTVDGQGKTLASTRAVLTVFKNGQEHTGYDNVPEGWHFAVGGHGGVAFGIVAPARCAIL